MEKGFSIFQKALNFVEDPAFNLAPIPPLSDMDFRRYCDSVGQIIHADELRRMIFLGGIDSSLRRVLWKLLLNVYPEKMTGKERMDYVKRKSNEYLELREVWLKELQQKPNPQGELAYVTSMVKKDVLRTDRLHPFFSGNDDNQNITALFNILTTFSLNHPSVSYCQGMSDFCSCILVAMQGDEAQAYICFCALMSRIKENFMVDGIAMTKKFAHLSEALEYYDPEFFDYLKFQQADDLLFCYRWLLLEMKREFAFEDALVMLEVLWSSIPPCPPNKELPLYEKHYEPFLETETTSPKSIAILQRQPRESPYTKVCSLRKQNSSMSISTDLIKKNHDEKKQSKLEKRLNKSLDDSMVQKQRIKDKFRKAHLSLDETKLTLLNEDPKSVVEKIEYIMLTEDVIDCTAIVSIETEPQQEIPTPLSIDCTNGTNPFITDIESNHKIEEESVNHMSKADTEESISSVRFKQVSGLMDGQIQDLKEKLNASKRGIIASLDKIEKGTSAFKDTNKPKLVKNFNEFLNITTINKNSISDKLNTTTNALKRLPSVELEENSILKPLMRFTKSPVKSNSETSTEPNLSLDESDKTELNYFGYSQLIPASDGMTNGTQEQLNLSNNVPNEDDEVFDIKTRTNSGIFFWENPLPEDLPTEILGKIPQDTNLMYVNNCNNTESIMNHTEDITDLINNSHIQDDSDPDISSDSSSPKAIIAPTNPFYDHITNHIPLQEQTLENDLKIIDNKIPQRLLGLPSPDDFGGGNPFLIFLCLTLLLQHRDTIIRNRMDYNETAIHFDKMVRKHNVHRVLNQARKMYADYLKLHMNYMDYYKIAQEFNENQRQHKEIPT